MEVKADIKVGKVRRLGPQVLALAISGIAGALFPFILGVFNLKLVVGGAFLGCSLTLVLALFEKFFYSRRLQKLNIKSAILIKSFIYSILIGVSYFIMVLILGGGEMGDGRKLNYESVFSFSLVVSLLISSFVSISRILGQNELLRLISGRYHTPREEDRIVMFLDLEGSTAIAEKIGAVPFLKLLNDFIFDITGPILDSGGEIYKYVGDGVIVTWTMKAGLKQANCLISFFVMRQKLRDHGQNYLQKYQVIPDFRAGIHCGKVVIGEMGDFKREIAILGDTVNTSARIISECSARDQRVLISENIFNILPQDSLQKLFEFQDLGAIHLKGKEKEVKLISVSIRTQHDEVPSSLMKWSFSIPRIPKIPSKQELVERWNKKKAA